MSPGPKVASSSRYAVLVKLLCDLRPGEILLPKFRDLGEDQTLVRCVGSEPQRFGRDFQLKTQENIDFAMFCFRRPRWEQLGHSGVVPKGVVTGRLRWS